MLPCLTFKTIFVLFLEIVNVFSGSSTLTEVNLANHDIKTTGQSVVSDISSESGRTFQTWTSNWSDCTRATFGGVEGLWNSCFAIHKEVADHIELSVLDVNIAVMESCIELSPFGFQILAVLAAVAETIQSSDGVKESETAYFGALVCAC